MSFCACASIQAQSALNTGASPVCGGLQLAVSGRGPIKCHDSATAHETGVILPGGQGICLPSRAICWPSNVCWLRHVRHSSKLFTPVLLTFKLPQSLTGCRVVTTSVLERIPATQFTPPHTQFRFCQTCCRCSCSALLLIEDNCSTCGLT